MGCFSAGCDLTSQLPLIIVYVSNPIFWDYNSLKFDSPELFFKHHLCTILFTDFLLFSFSALQ